MVGGMGSEDTTPSPPARRPGRARAGEGAGLGHHRSPRRVWARNRDGARTLAGEAGHERRRGARRAPRRGPGPAAARSASSQRLARSRVERAHQRPRTAAARRPPGRHAGADEPARRHVEGGVRERVGRPQPTQRSIRGPMAEQVDGPQARSTPTRARGGRARSRARERAHDQAVERRVGIALGGQPSHALEHPRAAPERSRCSRTATNGCRMSKWSTRTSSLRPVSKNTQPAEREGLERASEARPRPARRARHAPHLAVLAGVELDEAVALPEGPPPHHDRVGPVERHGAVRSVRT